MSLRNKKVIAGLAALTLLVVGGVLYYRHATRFDDVASTSTAPTAQTDYDQGEKRNSNSSGSVNQGGAVDTGGTDVPTNVAGVSSASGLITVKSPAKDTVVATGSLLSGTANGLENVQYRVVDNTAGVIAQGTLKVVNGAFSGKFEFSPKGDTGKIDVFSLDPMGSEVNYVELAVRFKE